MNFGISSSTALLFHLWSKFLLLRMMTHFTSSILWITWRHFSCPSLLFNKLKTNKQTTPTNQKQKKSWNNHLRIARLIYVQSKNNTIPLSSDYTVLFFIFSPVILPQNVGMWGPFREQFSSTDPESLKSQRRIVSLECDTSLRNIFLNLSQRINYT